MRKPVVTIIGRVNVGKSTLFNRLTHSRSAIVENTPGVTRDRKESEIVLKDRIAILSDTGGMDIEITDLPLLKTQEQTRLSVSQSDLIIFVVDGRSGLLPGDADIAQLLRVSGKPVILAINKMDDPSKDYDSTDFLSLGFPNVVTISAEHGLGVLDLEIALSDLLDELGFPETSDTSPEQDAPEETRVAVVGRPNVGKSSLINAILNEERHIVTDIPGTTRDPIDSIYRYGGNVYRFIDTAGLKRIGRTHGKLDKVTALMSRRSIERCEVSLLVFDASQGFLQQDARIGGYIDESGRACIVVANKWDLMDRRDETLRRLQDDFRSRYAFLDWAPMVAVSCLTKHRVFKLFQLIDEIKNRLVRKVPTSDLNKMIHDIQVKHAPPLRKNHRPMKLYYAVQVSSLPPTFKFFTNSKDPVHFSYTRFIVNQIRSAFDYEGCPIRVVYQYKRD